MDEEARPSALRCLVWEEPCRAVGPLPWPGLLPALLPTPRPPQTPPPPRPPPPARARRPWPWPCRSRRPSASPAKRPRSPAPAMPQSGRSARHFGRRHRRRREAGLLLPHGRHLGRGGHSNRARRPLHWQGVGRHRLLVGLLGLGNGPDPTVRLHARGEGLLPEHARDGGGDGRHAVLVQPRRGWRPLGGGRGALLREEGGADIHGPCGHIGALQHRGQVPWHQHRGRGEHRDVA
mmetsp:Transcript_50018/g.161818  ORF Transcript_50018/g.161818 Transcript_50018/m.161818 type:complete len:235 (+) Transcript_50018:2132-2836(+)